MTRRRLAALAQALVIAVILLPGLPSGGPALAQRDGAAARGIGCTTRAGAFRGPRIPGDPPPPPGSRTAADPSAAPAATATPLETTSPELDPPESELGDGSTALLASTGVRVAQAEPDASPPPADPAPGPVDDAGPAARSPDPATESVVDPLDPSSDTRPARERRRVRGIDVSHHNGDIDYDLVLAAGRTFAYIKATQDTTFRDPMFAINMQRARQAGVITGAYHFFDYTLDGAEQADHFLDHVEAAGGLIGSLPPVVDVECWGPSGVSTHLTSAQRLRDFIDRVYERTGRRPIIYTSVFMWDQVVGGSDGFADLPLWAACWGCDTPPSLASGWEEWRFWQTGVARIPRVGRLDGNLFNGDQADLAALVLRPFSIEAGAAVVGSTSVALDLGGLDGDEIRTSTDGVTWSDWRPLRGRPIADMEPIEGPQTLSIQLRAEGGSESPIFSDDITLDLAGPNLDGVALTIAPAAVRADASLVPVTVRWRASDGVTGLADATVGVACGERAPTSLLVPGAAAPGEVTPWEATTFLASGATCEIRIEAPDGSGHVSSERVTDVATAFLPADPSERVTHVGVWRRDPHEGANGGAAHVAASPDARVEAVVAGDEAAIVGVRGPSGGRGTVTLDGVPVASVDLYAPTIGAPEVVATVALSRGSRHVVGVTPDGAADPASRGTDVALDGIIVLTTRPGGLDVPEPTPKPEPSAVPSPTPGPTGPTDASLLPGSSASIAPTQSPAASSVPAASSPAPSVSPAPPSPSPTPLASPTAAPSDAPVDP